MILNRPSVRSDLDILRPLLEPGSTVVDVGSNRGGFYAAFLEDGCSVISIEPNFHNVSYQRVRFQDAIAAKRLTIYHRGCSDKSEQATLFINNDLDARLSSFDKRWPSHFPDSFTQGKMETHQLICLDQLLEPHFVELAQRFALLKVDTEGLDLEVLRGYFSTTAAVPRPDFVMSEIHTSERAANSIEQSMQLLAREGFDRFRVLICHGPQVFADSPWFTERQVRSVTFDSVNSTPSGFGVGPLHGNLIATTSLKLSEARGAW